MPKLPQPSAETPWPEAMATVTACRYTAGAGRAIAFGLPTARHFLVTFNFWAPDANGTDVLHTAELTSAKPMPQGTLFPIRYNPDDPHETAAPNAEPHTAPTRIPLIAVGFIGSAVLSLVWLLLLRGCR
ncbi:MAG TPA: hypothetical protein VM865_06265 [Acidobacteriaceae bacterium]|jgi:hypothetical protein|nr:hypothetical protein [Acidobacteriaceae bacterium]